MSKDQNSKAVLRNMSLVVAALAFNACAYHPDRPLLHQQWATDARENKGPEQQEIRDTCLRARWKVKGDKGWKVAEHNLESARGVKRGQKVVVRVPVGSFAQLEPVELKGVRLEIIGKGPDVSRLILDAGARGFVLNGGSLLVKDVTVSCYSSEGMTVLGGDAEFKNVVVNGARHGLFIARGVADIHSSVFAGNEAAIDMGKEASVTISSSNFLRNWDDIHGEKPLSLTAYGCQFTETVNKVFAFRMHKRVRVEHCMVVQPQSIGWEGLPETAKIEGNLMPAAVIIKPEIARKNNRAIGPIEQFPDATPQGLPRGFPVSHHMLLKERSKHLGTGESVKKARKFAEDEAVMCLMRAERFLGIQEVRKAKILKSVAYGFIKPYPTLRSRYQERLDALRAGIVSYEVNRAEEKRRAKAGTPK